MEFEQISFPENTLIKLITPLSDTFTIKTPKISINRTMKSIKIVKEDGINEPEDKKLSKLYTEEEQNLKNIYNMNLYKSTPPKTTLVYSDNENNILELNLLGQAINYDYLVNILQLDLSISENFIDENYGTFIDNKNNNINLNSKINKKLIYVKEPKNEKEAKIIFDSKFESGNLRMAIKLDSDIPNEYDLIIRKDYNNEKNYSWFFFSIESDRETDIKFNIINLIKKKIMFDEQNKIRILVYNKNDKWTRNTSTIQYYQNNIRILPKALGVDNCIIINDEDKDKDKLFFKIEEKEDEKNEEKDDDKEKENINKINDKGDKEEPTEPEFFFTLSFCYHVDKKNINIPIYFSLCYPYTYSTLQEYLYKLSINKKYRNKIKFSTLNKTICGNPLDILYLSNFNCSMNDIKTRQSIIFTARVHPGETSGSYVIESVINNLLNNTSFSNNLLNKYIFKIIPMLNPDGVIHGHYRTNILGKDLNRMWQDPRANITPTIYYLKKLISINKPYFFCDFHGHSNMPNCALYCCSPPKKKKNKFFNISNSKSYHFYEEKVFMRIFEEEAKYYEKTGEKYTIQKSKQKSARGVLYNEFNIYLSYALETGLMAKYNKPNNIINNTFDIILEPSTIGEYNQIGCDYVSSLIKWDTKSKFYAVLKKIREEEENKKKDKEKEKDKDKDKEKDKEKEKDKDKDKEINFTNNIKESRNNRNKKIIKLTKINTNKNKDLDKNKKEKEIKNAKIIHNSMMIIPQFLENEIKKEFFENKDSSKNDVMNQKK